MPFQRYHHRRIHLLAKELTLRYSALATLQDCQLKFKLSYASGLHTPPSPRLVLGSAYHALMQGHYESFRDTDTRKQPRDLAAARHQAAIRLTEYVKAEGRQHYDEKMRDQLRWMYQGYVERWDTEPAMDRFVVIDERRVVPVLTYKGVKVFLQVTADLIGHHREWNRWLLIDHKTASQRDASKEVVAKENQLDPQRGLYAACYSLFGPKKGRIPIFAAYHNVVRTDQLKREMSMEERFARTPVFYTEKELLNIWAENKVVIRKAVEIHLGIGDIYSSPDPTTCSWKCPWVAPHLAARANGRDVVQVALDYGAQRDPGWQPLVLEPRGKEASEHSDRTSEDGE